MRKIENELDELVYEEYCEELDANDKEIEDHKKIIKTKDEEIKSYKNLIKKLKKFDDLNNPEARKIINTLMLLK